MSKNSHMTITEFLEARIAEDEKQANDLMGEREGDRMLAECAAKRVIIKACERLEDQRLDSNVWSMECTDDVILKPLAAIYAYHSDYQQEWAL